MTVNIDYEADKKLDFDYEKIIREVINGALDFEECPYETEVNVKAVLHGSYLLSFKIR